MSEQSYKYGKLDRHLGREDSPKGYKEGGQLNRYMDYIKKIRNREIEHIENILMD